eukprot:Gregarina_sp_Poly_1__10615@NODE_794_length_6258_cov_104_655952_g581_i0_p1_GENE_NODE_794_length_6258_cov_104_655952_g581_i0NODE_794_length_6258_cov_104_655952_g581_i0_p1_ORF_typecomplete_len2065_score310_45Carboxyl_trans/PF01039_22/2_4e116ACC_central/PF08326_12/7_6e11ACC_central/PF08326_12/3_3e26_NODE_794_length_6258_cov_104_655952_g581_i08766197
MKNRLMYNMLEAVKHNSELMEQAGQFECHLRRLAAFSKIDYSGLAHEARQLLLTRRDKTFQQKTHELVETLWDVLESYNLQQVPSGPTSPVTFGGRLLSTYFPSPTPGSGGMVAQSVGSHSCASGSSVAMHPQVPLNGGSVCGFPYLSGMSIGSCALDLSKFPTDSLVAILAHHNPKMKKLALHILVMRTFGIRQGKIHDFRVRAQGESWDSTLCTTLPEKTPVAWNLFDPDVYAVVQGGDQRQRQNAVGQFASRNPGAKPRTYSPSPKHSLWQSTNRPRSPDSGPSRAGAVEVPSSKLVIPSLASAHDTEASRHSEPLSRPTRRELNASVQEVNSLVAVWTHEAIFSYEFLTSECDPLQPDISANSPAAAVCDPRIPTANTEGSMTSRLDATGANNGSALASRYVAAGSRLHHMLNAFAGTSDDPQSAAGKSQQTTAFLLENVSDFENNFFKSLTEISQLQNFLPLAPPAVDGRILLCVVLDLATRTIAGADDFEPSHTSLAGVINKHADLLQSLNFNLVWFGFLGSEPAGGNHHPDAGGGGRRRQKIRFLPQDTPGLKCFYYRNIRVLTPASNYTACEGAASPPQSQGKRSDSVLSGGGRDERSEQDAFVEVPLLRHCEIPLFQFLELRRLRHFFVTKHPTSANNVHLFEAVPKGRCKTDVLTARFFVRIITNVTEPLTSEVGLFEQERCFVGGLNALELSLRESASTSSRPVANHHILMTVVYIPQAAAARRLGVHPPRSSPSLSGSGPQREVEFLPETAEALKLTPSAAEQIARNLYERYSKRVQKLGASVIEIRFKTRGWQILGHVHGSPSLTEGVYPYRIVLDNPTGQTLRSRRFVEIQNPSTGERVFAALDSADSLSTLILKSSSSSDYTIVPGKTTAVSQHLPVVSPVSLSQQTPVLPRKTQEAAAPTMTLISMDPNSLLSMLSNRDRRELHDYDGKPVDTPHPWAGPLESKRAQAAALQTLYIYDFIDLLEVAVKNMWRKCPKYLFGASDDLNGREASECSAASRISTRPNNVDPPLIPAATTLVPDRVVEAVELALNKNGDFVEMARSPGQNECGMVAWRVLLRTPEFPKGRRIILIGNDVTTMMGTFGVQEDLLFQRASELARVQGIPRVYIAVNSGARMGLATEVQQAFKVEWIDAENPTRGFKYLYLSEADYKRLQVHDSVVAEPVPHPVEGKVYKIVDIVGTQIGLGVENLCGSGAIAGETSRAYKASMTLTYVTGRTVGIGAYLTRLGHRVIQKCTGAPILLTGFQALNRLIGRQVYTSNEEIGGVDVMHCNGVAHLVVQSDLEGCERILEWLSYVPEHREGPLPVMIDPSDPISRRVMYRPSSSTEDPRLMLTGCLDSNGNWQGGILDRGSFREVMKEWAKSVIVGRGRLGGIPVGVISVETRVTEALIPADPAMPLTSEVKLTRAGQVWFPESAYKTAQAVNDFNNEEIPLIIFANWRGFSGGQRDMFFEVLKFGSMIVDALVDFRQPCFVYIPPKAELRGGAWVVVDPRINSDFMEMFADPDSRGGVLEPSGTVEIKFREKALREAATRSDPELRRQTKEDLKLAEEGVPIDDPRRQVVKEQREARLALLLPVFKQVAVHFADLHDTPVRMKRKHAVHDVVHWEKSRQFFYWRLRRQLILFNLRNEAIKYNPKLSLVQAQRLIYKWASESGHSVENSQQFVQWACHSIQDLSRRLHALRTQYMKDTVVEFCKESVSAVAEGLKTLDAASHERLFQNLRTQDTVENRNHGNLQRSISERQQAALERITMSARLADK